jgi:glycine hydroxymethyltransferase
MTCNRNVIPNDPNGAWYASGLRLGTPALTTLGVGRDEMREIAGLIDDVLRGSKPGTRGDQASAVRFETEPAVLERTRGRVADLLARHPLYPEIDLS